MEKSNFNRAVIYMVSMAEAVLLALLTFAMNGYIKADFWFCALGLAAMLIAIFLHICGKKSRIFYLLSITVNLAASAMFCAMYYTSVAAKLLLSELVLSLFPSVGVLTVTYLLLHISHKLRPFATLGGVVLSLAVAVYDVVQWVRLGDVCYSFGFFSTVVAFMCLLAMLCIAKKPSANALRYASFAGFGIFAVIAVVVLVIISEGDFLEVVFEGSTGIDSGSVKSKKQNGGKV